ncbi:YceI family protein [Zunongwangia endophytica]|uniref:YceI family protein n=1 Tax=Zunongwangia endophytica TaxID=1808945 RepID=A0ABV8H2I6_9FLAO|nr:YceI family protein [Zunongwangia endophytica]MDN3596585.1 YceI family protein [Zunongwangia endophytica]
MKKNVLKGALASLVVIAMMSFTSIIEKVNVKNSTVEWTGEKVTGSHNGNIDLKSGFLDVEGDKITGGEFVMDMTSIDVTDLEGEGKGKLEGHLKSDDFFGVSNHPEAKLVINTASKKSENTYGVVADLTIKGITNPVTFDMNYDGKSATADLTIDRTKYDVRYGSGSFFDNLGDKTIYDEFEIAVDLKF